MPNYTAEYSDFGYQREHHIADNKQQVREYYEVEMPWCLPVLILEEVEDENKQK